MHKLREIYLTFIYNSLFLQLSVHDARILQFTEKKKERKENINKIEKETPN